MLRPGKQAEGDGLARLLDEASHIAADDPRRRAASIAMFEEVARHWNLDGAERETLLGGVTKSTWSDWKQQPRSARVRPDTRERIANLYAIDLMAHSIFGPEFADQWVRQPNASLDEHSPAAVMLGGKIEDIVSVRRYLERAGSGSPHASRPSATIADAGENAIRPALERAVAGLRNMVAREPERYEPALTAALEALGTFNEVGADDAALGIRGEARDSRRGVEQYGSIGIKGGKVVQRHAPDIYEQIGHKGGARVKKLIADAKKRV